MAFVLKLYNGTDTVDFMDTAFLLADKGLKLSTPKKKQVWSGNSIYANGANLVATSFENREISITFQITGATRDELNNNKTTIERILNQARTKSMEHIGSKTELQYQWDGAAGITYFDIIDGEIEWPDDVMSVEQVHQKTASGKWVIYDFELKLIAFPFASSVSPVTGTMTSLPLTNGNGTNVTTGLKVYNHDDSTAATHDNWVSIPAANIDGDYPANIRLTLQADSGEAEKTSKIYIGVRKGNQNFKSILEDNAEEFVIGGVAPTTDTDVSSGNTYTALVFSGTTEQALIRWALSDAETEATQGPFRFFGRCRSGSHWDAAANYRIRILYGTSSLYESEWRKPLDAITELFDFGTIFLPPWLVGTPTGIAGLKIEIQGKRDTAGTTTINLDYLALLPQDGGYRVLDFRAVGISQFEYVVDDGKDDTVYHINSSGKKTGLPYGLLPKITLAPNTAHKMYFIQEGTSKNCEITRQLIVKVELQPLFNGLV